MIAGLSAIAGVAALGVLLALLGLEKGLWSGGVSVQTIAWAVLLGWGILLILFRGAISLALRDRHRMEEKLHDRINLLHSDLDNAKQHGKMLEGRLRVKETEEHREREVYKSDCIVDPVTGLFNEDYFYDILPNEINRAKRDKKQLVLTLIQVEGLEDIRRREGDATVESAIRTIAGEIKLCAKRAGDFSFHFNDDHFGVLFSGLSLDNTKRFVTFIHDHLQSAGLEYQSDEGKKPLRFLMGSLIGFGDSLPESETLYNETMELLASMQNSGETIRYQER